MDTDTTVKFKVCLTRQGGASRGRKLEEGERHAPESVAGRVPRVTRLLVQAHFFQRMLDRGEAKDLADLARRYGLTRARVTQIMGLTLLAPDIQEAILFLPAIDAGPDPITAIHLRATGRRADWAEQRSTWSSVRSDDPLALD
jgi:hypothetical protein